MVTRNATVKSLEASIELDRASSFWVSKWFITERTSDLRRSELGGKVEVGVGDRRESVQALRGTLSLGGNEAITHWATRR